MYAGAGITLLLGRAGDGDGAALNELLGLVYPELKRLAALAMRREWFHHTLQRTAVVHEVFLRLFGKGRRTTWENRGEFFLNAAAEMNRVLIEHARRRAAQKRWGALERVNDEPAADGTRLDEALLIAQGIERLQTLDSRGAQVVQLRFFVGFTHDEIARLLGVDVRTVERDWNFSKAWLRRLLSE